MFYIERHAICNMDAFVYVACQTHDYFTMNLSLSLTWSTTDHMVDLAGVAIRGYNVSYRAFDPDFAVVCFETYYVFGF